jgi:hypothetical protein
MRLLTALANGRLPSQRIRPGWLIRRSQCGMTILEVMIAMLMMVIFWGVYVTVTEYIARFMGEAQGADGSAGLLQDQHGIHQAMDVWVEYLSQPGVPESTLFDMETKNLVAKGPGCVSDPVFSWGLPGKSLSRLIAENGLPGGYKYCLRSTSLKEQKNPDTYLANPATKPGIYVLYAIPESPSLAALPTRRLFCRPKPYC